MAHQFISDQETNGLALWWLQRAFKITLLTIWLLNLMKLSFSPASGIAQESSWMFHVYSKSRQITLSVKYCTVLALAQWWSLVPLDLNEEHDGRINWSILDRPFGSLQTFIPRLWLRRCESLCSACTHHLWGVIVSSQVVSPQSTGGSRDEWKWLFGGIFPNLELQGPS